MKLKKVLAGIMAVVTAVTASVCGLSVSAGAVSEKKEYTGHGESTIDIPILISKAYNDVHYKDTYIGSIIGKADVGRYIESYGTKADGGCNVIVEDLQPTDIVTFSFTSKDGNEHILDVVISSPEKWADIYLMGLIIIDKRIGATKSDVSINEFVSDYNKDLKFASQDTLFKLYFKDYDSNDRKFSEVESIRPFIENNNYDDIDWKITIEPGNKENSSSRGSDISSLSFGKISTQTYTGKAIKPTITIKDGSKKLVSGTDYTVTYKNNTKPGKATATITGKGDYTGTKTVTFNIAPKKVKLSAKTSGAGAVLSWKKSTGATGYEIYYSTNGGKFRKLTTVNAAKYTAELTSCSAYKFRVRPYVNINGKKVYGKWSNTVSCK